MPAFALLSAKGSPGVTTTAAALAAAATKTSRALLAELDPSGGSVHVMTGKPVAAGLVDAAGRLRREATPAAIDENTATLPDGIPSLVAPTSGPATESVIDSARDRWMPALRSSAFDVMVDAGRWEPSQRTARRIYGADVVVVVCRPTVAGVASSHQIIDRLWELARRPVVTVVVGRRPYVPEEVAAHLGVPLAGTMAWDPRGAAHLWARGMAGRWHSTRLARSARVTLSGLGSLAAGLLAATTPEVGQP